MKGSFRASIRAAVSFGHGDVQDSPALPEIASLCSFSTKLDMDSSHSD
ncbi:hypothetical protein [Azospirillum argentinense]